MSKKLRIAFMGTPDFAVQTLRALIESEHDVVCVYSQPPRPKGRGQHVQKSPVHELAEQHHIPVFTPTSLKTSEAQAEFSGHNVDVAIVAAYGLLLPQAILDSPQYGCLNVHGSLLPRWRGASPIQQSIWAGDKITGITIMQMDKGLDTGAMIAKSEVMLGAIITASELHDELAVIGAKLTLNVLETLAQNGTLIAEKQSEAEATYAHLLKKSDGIVDWEQSATQIDRQIRALNPWPGVWAEIQGRRFKILSASMSISISSKPAGTILDRTGQIACGENSTLKLTLLQPEGKKAMDFTSALNGGYIDAL